MEFWPLALLALENFLGPFGPWASLGPPLGLPLSLPWASPPGQFCKGQPAFLPTAQKLHGLESQVPMETEAAQVFPRLFSGGSVVPNGLGFERCGSIDPLVEGCHKIQRLKDLNSCSVSMIQSSATVCCSKETCPFPLQLIRRHRPSTLRLKQLKIWLVCPKMGYLQIHQDPRVQKIGL